MSRIGKKPIPLATGVKYKVEGNTVLVEGPKGKVSALIAEGITLETKDGVLHVNRESDKFAAVHGLTRALVFNAVHGVTAGWKKELDIVGIGYRAELKGKNMVVFTLGTPSRRTSSLPASTARRWARWPLTCARCASRTLTRTRACGTRMRS
jgi:large subunit ribosomal protein L6